MKRLSNIKVYEDDCKSAQHTLIIDSCLDGSNVDSSYDDNQSSTYVNLNDLEEDINFDDDDEDNDDDDDENDYHGHFDKSHSSLLINSLSETNLTHKSGDDINSMHPSKSSNFNKTHQPTVINNYEKTQKLVLESPKKKKTNLKCSNIQEKTLKNATLTAINNTNIVPSKSETNLFENSKIKPTKYNIYDVVSLNNLTASEIYSNTSNMIDLSKTQILNRISDESFVLDK